jgi:hypothetical protein
MGHSTTRATFEGKWNPKRGDVTYRIGKDGCNAFLLFGVDDLPGLYQMIGAAIEGTNDSATG